MTRAHYDYVALEHEFVTTRPKLSIRELGRRHDIPDSKTSSLHAQAKKKDGAGRTWYDKQTAFEVKSTDKTLDALAEKDAARRLRESEVVDNAIALVDEAITSARETVRARIEFKDDEGKVVATEPKYRVPIRELNGLIDRLGVLLAHRGDPGSDEEGGLNFGGDHMDPAILGAGNGPALILQLIGATRGTAPRPVGRGQGAGSLPGAPDTGGAQLP